MGEQLPDMTIDNKDTKTPYLEVFGDDGSSLIRLYKDGTSETSDAHRLDEAATIFWREMLKQFPLTPPPRPRWWQRGV